MNKPRIGVFGSAFDPPTLGHLDVIKQFADQFDRILLVPSAQHAFNKRSLPFEIRVEMLARFVNSARGFYAEKYAEECGLEKCALEVCELEAQLLEDNPDTPVYTFDLLVALEEKYQNRAEITFIRGPDNAHPETWSRFYRSQEIEARWSVVTAQERVNVRSSTVRAILNKAGSADNNYQILDELLLPSVSTYIQEHKLYQD